MDDPGRFDVTHKAADMHVFKVPSWRNVALEAPYFHMVEDGTFGLGLQAIRTTIPELHGTLAVQQPCQRDTMENVINLMKIIGWNKCARTRPIRNNITF